jgi:hypothetical protein
LPASATASAAGPRVQSGATKAILHEEYEWKIDKQPYRLRIHDTTLTVSPDPANAHALRLQTSRDLMYHWVEGASEVIDA